MSVFLLLLGVVTTAAGFALVASGATIHEGGLETDIITPGTIAAVGGLLLVGLGLAVRELQRIEQTLVGGAGLRPARPGEATAAAAAEPPVRIPFPPKPKPNANPQPEQPLAETTPPSSAAPTAPATTEDGAFERVRAKFPTLARPENGAILDATEGSTVPQPSAPAAAGVAEVKKTTAAAGGRTNGAAPAGVAPRLDAKVRPAASPDRAKASVFNAFWPAAPRRERPATPVQVAAPLAPLPADPASAGAAAPESSASAGETAAPVSALKSGVVEGMAYTLYSDGSIEAQLPQGKLRFGSITALRNHIERGA